MVMSGIVHSNSECIQMVVGYLDIFVFEEIVFAFRPVVDSYNSVLEADSRVVVSDEREFNIKLYN